MSAKAGNTANTSSFGLPGFSGVSFAQPNVANTSGDAFNPSQIYIDPEIVRSQKTQSLSMLDNQLTIAKDRAKAEYEAQKQAISMKSEHDLSMANASIEQSKVQALFALDQQFQQRRMEIEQRAQEQKLQIEATSSQLLMTAEQQRLEKDMQEKMAKVYGNLSQASIANGSFLAPNGSFVYPVMPNLAGGSVSNLSFSFPESKRK